MPLSRYERAYRDSIEDPAGFWAGLAADIAWDRRWDRVFDASAAPEYRWFVGGRLNTCYNAVDRHVDGGRGDQLALVFDSAMTGAADRFTFRQLKSEVSRLAGLLRSYGVVRGDRVIIFMPAIPEAVFAMLACARLGAVHAVVFGGFAADQLALRIDHARPKVILSASCGLEPGRVVLYQPLLDEALARAAWRPERCLVLQRPEAVAELVEGRDADWASELANAVPAGCVSVAATDPLYILYTSGTTGPPKAVLRDHGGHAVALHYCMSAVFGVDAGDVFWAASDIGWVAGHSYAVYGPLLRGVTTVLYEGKPVGTPDSSAYWRVAAEHAVNAIFTTPTALRAIRQADVRGRPATSHDLSNLRSLFVAGERCDPETLDWARRTLGVPVIDTWGQTETGWPICANSVGLGMDVVKPGSTARPVPGYQVRILDDEGREETAGHPGNVVLKLPLPPGCAVTLFEDQDGYQRSYLDKFPGYFLTGDAGLRDADGYVWITGRIDDVINVAGHRLSTWAIEEAILSHPDIAECAVIGVPDPLKGEVPLGLVVVRAGVASADDLAQEAVARVRQHVGPVASFKACGVVRRLPKTRTGKIMRSTIRELARGSAWQMPATIDEPATLQEIAVALQRLGHPVETITDSPISWVARHIQEYVETGGTVGHRFQGMDALLLTTRGRKTGLLRRTPLIYRRDGEHYVVVGSNGGADEHPSWYLNLLADPAVHVQVGEDTFAAVGRTAEETRPRLWDLMVAAFPPYQGMQDKTRRRLPVIVIARS